MVLARSHLRGSHTGIYLATAGVDPGYHSSRSRGMLIADPIGCDTQAIAVSKCVRVTRPMPYSLVIFDLDGTLVDSFPWFRSTVNAVAARYRFRQVKEEDVEMLRHASTREILDHLKISWWKIPLVAR